MRRRCPQAAKPESIANWTVAVFDAFGTSNTTQPSAFAPGFRRTSEDIDGPAVTSAKVDWNLAGAALAFAAGFFAACCPLSALADAVASGFVDDRVAGAAPGDGERTDHGRRRGGDPDATVNGPLHDQEGAALCAREENAGYRIGVPDSVRAITRRWISLVPSKIV
ncbi:MULTISPECIES: hypothetical protein [Streptomyces]|uniref:Uncharacterized protein n=1 Tax=Streptomyces chartreusis NRRL 3882 TaxID=1079985 RepID=A0A2N9BJB3_STRCX|nr:MULTISPECIES: hypothetical protein [Streptomyces]MYS95065.1 hypothetical protein [Streptomyces sp. SID5464]SOR83441.1 hypothetical protein SCNRRL3882_6887 [Streptomyces chartreusis NRRL 3882]